MATGDAVTGVMTLRGLGVGTYIFITPIASADGHCILPVTRKGYPVDDQ